LDVGRKNKNGILAGLSKDDAALLKPFLAPVDLPVRKLLEGRNRRIEYVYFLDSGLASVVASGGTDHSVEIAIIGREGMTGLPILLSTDRSPHETFMQDAGTGRRISVHDLHSAMAQSTTLRDRLLQFAHTISVQMGFTALANGRYKLEERLARWLLMALDRSDGDSVTLTHEFLAVMLGTRRPGITTALSELEKSNFVKPRRGSVTILSREALEETANGCYGGSEAEYGRLFGGI